MSERATVAIVGAGMAGLACAYHLAVEHGVRDVVLVDDREPLTLTSDKGTQAYRNWWPGPDDTMFRFVSRSIDLLERSADECGNHFRLNRRGYVFLTAHPDGAARLRADAHAVSAFGMGALREHDDARGSYRPAAPEGYRDALDGADLLTGAALRRAFPSVDGAATAALHVRRAGWLNAVAFGGWLLKRAVGAGVRVVRDAFVGIDAVGGRASALRLASGARVDTDRVVLAAGPRLPDIATALGMSLPLRLELHAKLLLRDTERAVPRDVPFLIWNDPVRLAWTAAERAQLERRDDARLVLAEMPGGVHLRPVDGAYGDELYVIWTYHAESRSFAWPPTHDPHYAEAAVRGVSAMLPAMRTYVGRATAGVVDGGYYCKAPDNRPLVGSLGSSAPHGTFVCGALSGYGIMGAHAAGDLLAAHVVGATLPSYAAALDPARWRDPAYGARVERWAGSLGQL